jgi:hypothetical protein
MPYKDKAAQADYQTRWLAERRDSFFADKVCVACGSRDELELHHKDPTKKVSHRIWSWSKERRQRELKKCEVRCRVCHQEKTREDGRAHFEHGTRTMYQKGPCRCTPCRNANTEYMREWLSQCK